MDEITITRFDEIEHDIISLTMGYYNDEEHAARALVMMDDGILERNPRKNWQKTGWKWTEYGEQYKQAFLARLRQKHGHKWIMREHGGVDIFAYSAGYHNGPECENCGYSFCHHCESEWDIPECSVLEVTPVTKP